MNEGANGASNKTVWIDIYTHAHAGREILRGDPFRDDLLQVRAAPRVNEEAIPISPAQHREWGRGGPEDRNILNIWANIA